MALPGLASPAKWFNGSTEPAGNGSALLAHGDSRNGADRWTLVFSHPEDLSAANGAIWMSFWWNYSRGSPGISASPPLEGCILLSSLSSGQLGCSHVWRHGTEEPAECENKVLTSSAKSFFPCGNKRRKLIEMVSQPLSHFFSLLKHHESCRKPVWANCDHLNKCGGWNWSLCHFMHLLNYSGQ